MRLRVAPSLVFILSMLCRCNAVRFLLPVGVRWCLSMCVMCGPLCGSPLRRWVLCGVLPSVWVPCVGPLCGSPVWVPCVGPLCGRPVWVPCVGPLCVGPLCGSPVWVPRRAG